MSVHETLIECLDATEEGREYKVIVRGKTQYVKAKSPMAAALLVIALDGSVQTVTDKMKLEALRQERTPRDTDAEPRPEKKGEM